MRRLVSILVAVVIVMMSIAGIGGTAVAAPTGSVTGIVQTDGDSPLYLAQVEAWYYDHDPLEKPVYAGGTRTNLDGSYTLTGLSADCRVRAYYVGYYSEYYATPNGVYYAPLADRVVVNPGETTSGIDFSLGLGKSILGHVYQDDGTTAIQGAGVSVYENMTDGGEWKWIAGGATDDNGLYSITAYAGPGTYKVSAEAAGWAEEFYDNQTSLLTGDTIVVPADSDAAGIDFTLTQTGWISGKVYQSDGATPLKGAEVRAYDNTTYDWLSGKSEDDGSYYINLDPGSYKIRASASGYMTQWWDNVTVVSGTDLDYWDDATPVTVAGIEVAGHNFSLLTVKAVSTDGATSVGDTTATLDGNLISKGANDNVTVSFEYDTDSGAPYASTTSGSVMNTTGAFSIPVSSLAPHTTYYFLAKAVGDVDTTPFYGTEMSFTTSTVPPSVTTNAASNLATTSATLNGTLTDKGTADNVTVSFAWGITAGGPYANTVAVSPDMTAPGNFSAPLSGLAPGTTYYYIARAVGDGSVDGAQVSFATLTTPPTVTTSAASNLATTTATLNGNLTAPGTADNVTVSFEWGLTTSYGSPAAGTPPSMSAAGTFTANLSGLTAGTTYHFRAIADGDGDPVYGSDMSFTTSTTPPTVTTSAATSLATTSASLNGSLGSLGTATSVNVSFEWGTTTSYGTETTAQPVTAIGAFTANLTGLTASTTYHFRAKAVGHGSAAYGEDRTFTTANLPDTTKPTISAVASSGFTKAGATITWTTNEGATSQVQYGLTEEYGSSTTEVTTLVTSHSVDLTGLKAGKTYHYRVVSKDAAGNQAESADDTFKTESSSGGMPAWAWVLIALGVVGVVGGAGYFAFTKMGKQK